MGDEDDDGFPDDAPEEEGADEGDAYSGADIVDDPAA